MGDDDITGLQQRIRQLEWFRGILDRAGDAIFIYTPPSGLVTDVNETACRMLGRARNDILSSPVDNLIELPGFTARPSTHEDTSASEETNRILPGRLMPLSGPAIPVEAGITFIVSGGQTYGIIVARGISDLPQREDSLSKSEEKYLHYRNHQTVCHHKRPRHSADANDEYVRLTAITNSKRYSAERDRMDRGARPQQNVEALSAVLTMDTSPGSRSIILNREGKTNR
jgi:PAS domain S-box-containing protein